MDRGLFEIQRERFLVIFSTSRYERTTAGEAARSELDHWLAAGETHLAGWVADEPAQALAYAGAAGAALLLMPSLFPNLRQLRELTPLSRFDDGAGGVSTVMNTPGSSSDSDSNTTNAFDFGNFDFGSMASNVLATFDSAMSAIDSAIDSAARRQ